MSQGRASSPDCSPDELVALAWQFPKEVLNNPALPLLCIEPPELWSKVVTYIFGGLREVELRHATPAQRHRLSQQIKQRIPTLTAEFQRLSNADYGTTWDMAIQKTLTYQSFEDSFAELFCLATLGSYEMHFTTPERSFEMYLLETRLVNNEKVDRPYYVVACWAGDENPGDGCVEVEHVLAAACAWLFDEISFEELRDTYFSQKFALDGLRGK
jgi:hypothetical protein